MNKKLEDVVKLYEQSHLIPGPVLQKVARLKAEILYKTNELEAIYNLVESHVPGLRQRIVMHYEHSILGQNTIRPLSKEHVAFSCSTAKVSTEINELLRKVQELPKEWTIVQITPAFNNAENLELNPSTHYTNSLFLTVLSCGDSSERPFTVRVTPSNINGERAGIVQEMHRILEAHKAQLTAPQTKRKFRNTAEKQQYYLQRQALDAELRALVLKLEDRYVKGYRTLFCGKLVDSQLEVKLRKKVADFIRLKYSDLPDSDKVIKIVYSLVKGSKYLNTSQLKQACKALVSTPEQLLEFMLELCSKYHVVSQEKHPVILVVDDNLDLLPWEMMDVLLDNPVSRVSSFYIAHALYMEHKSTIQNGYKIVSKPENLSFIINPDLTLTSMQNRITSFVEYWAPNARMIIGKEPTTKEFQQLLTSSHIFAYHGHGSGANYLSAQDISKSRINSVVFLFGCGSTKLVKLGPHVEMSGTHQSYFTACSPCLIGMLWEVTDLDTDIMSTEILAQWIPSAGKSWHTLEKSKWKKGEKIAFQNANKGEKHESDLLRVLMTVRKSAEVSFYITKCACIARGIPVRIQS